MRTPSRVRVYCFVGPSAETIRQMGDKARARTLALQAGVPTVPGSTGTIDSVEAGLAIAGEIGFPVMIKAAGGGGGRGIRVALNPAEFSHQAPQARAEARAAFGDDSLYLEKVIGNAHHIEVQVLGDGERAIHFFERECSLQRRRQKLWEEAPSVNLSQEVRVDLCASAVKLAESVGYRGAGTVEFLCDKQAGEYYFIEMNTRIQVEHPVTEMVTGFDLVRGNAVHSRRPATRDLPARRRYERSFNRSASERGGSGQEFPSLPRRSGVTECSERAWCAFRWRDLPRLYNSPIL